MGGRGTLAVLRTLAFLTARGIFSPFLRQRVRMLFATTRARDLAYLAELCEAGKLVPVIDRTYALAEAAAAIHYIEAGHARGKIVVVP
jgi:NADPH:quinone reductase-like Zn-dependent oxidoreductase